MYIKAMRSAVPAILATGLAAASLPSQAVDFDGYFRAGTGATSKNAARACYNLGISGGHYRLGNECDIYGEFGLSQAGTLDGASYKAKVMFNIYNPGTDTGASKVGINQMYVETKGLDLAPATNFWAGKRWYGRTDVHIVDTFFVNMSGVGAGADSIALGGGKLGVAYFGTDGGGATGASTNPGHRLNVDFGDLPVNPGGKLRLVGTFIKGNFDNATDGKGTSGFGMTVQHNQEITGIGANNTAWLQYAQGSAGLDSNFGTLTAKSSVKQVRLIESITWQVGAFGGQAIGLIGSHDKDDINGVVKYTELSVGGRGSYAVTKNFKLVAEAGYMEKKPDGQAKQKLAKFTFAPTLSTGPGFWNRPELRLYVTTAKWNAPANAASGLGGLTGIGDGKTKGTSYGAQAEIWF